MALPDSVRLKYLNSLDAVELGKTLHGLQTNSDLIFKRILPKMNINKLEEVMQECNKNSPSKPKELNDSLAKELQKIIAASMKPNKKTR
jgi:hypothetical protein